MTYYVSKYIDKIYYNDEYSIVYNYNILKCLLIKNKYVDYLFKNINKIIDEKYFNENLNELIKKKIIYINEESSTIDQYREDLKNVKLPLEIRFIPSFNCNEKCDYCIAKNNMNEIREYFDTNLLTNLEKLINEINEKSLIGPYTEVKTTIIGGEPTIKKNWNITKKFIEFINKMFEKSEHKIITNGYGINDEMLKECSKLNVKNFYLSYDITSKNKYKEAISKCMYMSLEKIIKKIISYDLNVIIDLKCDRESSLNKYIKESLKDFYESGKLKILTSPIIEHDEYDPLKSIQVDRHNITLYEKHEINDVGEKIKKFFSNEIKKPTLEKRVIRCGASHLSSICIFPNGKVVPCGQLYTSKISDNEILCDLKKLDFKNLKKFTHDFYDDEECNRCKDHYICGGKCYFSKNKKCNLQKYAVALNKKKYVEKLKEYIEKRYNENGRK